MNISRRTERGSALILSVIVVVIMIGVAGTYLSLTMIGKAETAKARDAAQAAFIAEAAAGNYINALNMDAPPSTLPVSPDPNMKDEEIRTNKTVRWLGGWFMIEDQAQGAVSNDEYREFMVTAEFGKAQRRLQVVVSKKGGGVFWNAIYAQNASGSDNYNMVFGGPSSSKYDKIRGDIYSGGKVTQQGYAQLRNEADNGPSNQVMYASDDADALTTTGATQTPPPNFVKGSQPSLDIAAMNYAARAAAVAAGDTSSPYYDNKLINVTDSIDKKGVLGFAAGETAVNQGLGRAKQIKDVNDPAHIFRLNPSDNGTTERIMSYSGMSTAKNDYFLEDSTQKKGSGSAGAPWTGSDGGQRLDVRANGNDKVYYIDGNLWLSNSPATTFQFLNNTGGDMKITIVIKGNVYLTDNLLYDKLKSNDALAIIAIKDENFVNDSPEDYLSGGSKYNAANFTGLTAAQILNKAETMAGDYNKVKGSGNIFFGDPGGGTTERFESFLFAENNFYDNNLGASGTNLTNIYGNMTAGNHVQVKRSPTAFKPFDITFDPRLRTGATSLPGLPGNLVDVGEKWKVLGWNTNPKQWHSGPIAK